MFRKESLEMLVLSRHNGQSIIIGDNIKITIIESNYGRCRVGIEAPKEMAVDREEVFERKKAEKENQ